MVSSQWKIIKRKTALVKSHLNEPFLTECCGKKFRERGFFNGAVGGSENPPGGLRKRFCCRSLGTRKKIQIIL
jgi:hypothetical protein